LLGRDAAGNIKPKNEWLHEVNWDLVVFDEYHFGAWRDTAKELFEGEDETVAKEEAQLEYAAALGDLNEDLGVLSEKEAEFLPITTKAYLYLSGTPFKAHREPRRAHTLRTLRHRGSKRVRRQSGSSHIRFAERYLS